MSITVLHRLLSLRQNLTHPDAPPSNYGSGGSPEERMLYASKNSTIIHWSSYTSRQRTIVHEVAAIAASFSLAAEILAVYWFCRMRRNFRRDLIFLLVLSDFFKSTWFLIFSIAAFVKEDIIGSHTPFCQAGGYFLQAGFSACDFAIMLMSLHMALQMFPPSRFSCLGSDGLYRIKAWVFGAWIVIPFTIAAIAFANPQVPAYAYQAAFCVLPYQPVAFRLALSWVPRYLICIYVVAVAIRIYLHVGKEFKLFGQEERRLSEASGYSGFTSSAAMPRTGHGISVSGQRSSFLTTRDVSEKIPDEEEGIAPDDASRRRRSSAWTLPSRNSFSEHAPYNTFNYARRQSVPSWATTYSGFNIAPIPEGPRSEPNSRRQSRQSPHEFVGVTQDFATGIGGSNPPRPSISSTGERSVTSVSASNIAGLPSIAEADPLQQSSSYRDHRSGDTVMQARRRAIQKSLRQLFIYPVVYIGMWLVPFVAQCLRYNPYFVAHPIFAVNTIAVFSQISIGFVDVCVLCWREQPWRHISGSDGTFLGSFKLWHRVYDQQAIHSHRHSSVTTNQGRDGGAIVRADSTTGLARGIRRWSFGRKKAATRVHQRKYSPWSLEPSSIATTLSHRHGPSGGSDRRHAETDQAYQRLALERADWAQQKRRSHSDRRSSTASRISKRKGSSHRREDTATSTRNWFDSALVDDNPATELM